MKHPNLFLLPKDDASPASAVLGEFLCECLGREFPLSAFGVVLNESTANVLSRKTTRGAHPLCPYGHTANQVRTGAAREYFCIAIDSSQPETVRDAIKKRLWPAGPEGLAGAKLADILQGRHEKKMREFRLEDYGVFIPSRTRKSADIRTHSFQHRPGFYRYRLAPARLGHLPEPLADYLQALFANCPNHLFNRTVLRASGVSRRRLNIKVPLKRTKEHAIIALAGESRGFRRVSSRHENLQKFFLAQNPNTIACEVPVWLEAWELAEHSDLFKTCAPLTGHIDVLRREDDGLIGVWDFKPRAAAERSAHVQVFLYALMLSLRTGLPLNAFQCGYFDEEDAYLFRPAQMKLRGCV